MDNETNNKMEFTNNNTYSRNFYEKDGLKIMSDYNSNKELVSCHMTKGVREIDACRKTSGWILSLSYDGRNMRTYNKLTWEEMITKWDKKLKEFKK